MVQAQICGTIGVMPMRPCLVCGDLASGSYCRDHRPRSQRHPNRGSGATSAKFRAETLAKTGGVCVMCGTAVDVTAHHVVPVAAGGSNDAARNGVPLCREHHLLAHRS